LNEAAVKGAAVVIIDEYGMASSELLTRVRGTAQRVMGKGIDLPGMFEMAVEGAGGKILIIVGDGCQLPCVADEHAGSVAYAQIQQADLWDAVCTKLTVVRRQTDPVDRAILEMVRNLGESFPPELVEALRARMMPWEDDLDHEALAAMAPEDAAEAIAVGTEKAQKRQMQAAAAMLAQSDAAALADATVHAGAFCADTHDVLDQMEPLYVAARATLGLDVGVVIDSVYFSKTAHYDAQITFGGVNAVTTKAIYGELAKPREVAQFISGFEHRYGKYDPRVPLRFSVWLGRPVLVRKGVDLGRGLVNGARVECVRIAVGAFENMGVVVSSPDIDRFNQEMG
jgi:acetyltransferase-like isoleucine patch superfamily enzyme